MGDLEQSAIEWMTDKEFMQVLSLCLDKDSDCRTCRLWSIDRCVEHLLREAEGLIERRTAENAALREKQRWISVTEKTPEYDMPQLALNVDGDALIANYAYGEWFDTWGQDVDVTHWMPLPEVPEEGEA